MPLETSSFGRSYPTEVWSIDPRSDRSIDVLGNIAGSIHAEQPRYDTTDERTTIGLLAPDRLKRPSANTPTRSYSIASDTSRKESWRERVQKALSV
ncbi:MAG: hypothetical protein QGG26_17435, partial [Candidatus Undinarchaeales archaeon]|nr:hypothetical protein [Candidatus Undinarchaeales archaeon]